MITSVTKDRESLARPPIQFYPDFLDAAQSRRWLAKSRALAWTRGEITMYGKKIAVPREESLFGDDFRYEYRGALLKAEPWPDFLLEAKKRIEQLCGLAFNFAVGNRYIDGKDSIGWHSDNFPQIGAMPPVASLSLGNTRRFKLRHKSTKEVIDYDLEDGSLLIMLPGCQEEWEHAVPKTARPVGERINWTFRPHVDALDGAKHAV
jgi:alkylated DNA repair dioxygenase AlkB